MGKLIDLRTKREVLVHEDDEPVACVLVPAAQLAEMKAQLAKMAEAKEQSKSGPHQVANAFRALERWQKRYAFAEIKEHMECLTPEVVSWNGEYKMELPKPAIKVEGDSVVVRIHQATLLHILFGALLALAMAGLTYHSIQKAKECEAGIKESCIEPMPY